MYKEYIVSLDFLNYNYTFMRFYDFVFINSVYVSWTITFFKNMYIVAMEMYCFVSDTCIISMHHRCSMCSLPHSTNFYTQINFSAFYSLLSWSLTSPSQRT